MRGQRAFGVGLCASWVPSVRVYSKRWPFQGTVREIGVFFLCKSRDGQKNSAVGRNLARCSLALFNSAAAQRFTVLASFSESLW